MHTDELSANRTTNSEAETSEAEETRIAKATKQFEDDFRRQRRQEFLRLCPSEYRKSDPDRLRQLAPTQYDRAMSWRFGKQGLLFCGASGKGKTRTAWQIISREFNHIELNVDRFFPSIRGRDIKCYTAADWLSLSQRFKRPESQETLEALMGIRTSDLLFVDDMFKLDTSANMTALVWFMLEERTSRSKPTIITMNGTMKELLPRMKESDANDRLMPIARRIQENFMTVQY